MTWRERWHRLIGVVRGDDGRVAEEIRFHRDMLEERHRRLGLPPAAAKRAARLELGGETQVVEAWRDQRGLPFIETLLQPSDEERFWHLTFGIER